ncbi:2-amino-1-hydroxyethylphosphonate dioxygenase (glycine-forming)-like [Ciona intestinalis]
MQKNIDEVFDLYSRFGAAKYDGEEVTQLEHALQCAQQAENAGSSVSTILGAFFHDVGHLLEGCEGMESVVGHLGSNATTRMQIGAVYLSKMGFPPDVTDFAGGHVDAKRYLVFKKPGYHEHLSECSKRTLIQQGGAMESKEAGEFERMTKFHEILRMRHWDEEAKVINKVTPTMDYYKEMCIEYFK